MRFNPFPQRWLGTRLERQLHAVVVTIAGLCAYANFATSPLAP
jgi:hypothetical protein